MLLGIAEPCDSSRFYLRAAAVKHAALSTAALGVVDTKKSLNRVICVRFPIIKSVCTQVGNVLCHFATPAKNVVCYTLIYSGETVTVRFILLAVVKCTMLL